MSDLNTLIFHIFANLINQIDLGRLKKLALSDWPRSYKERKMMGTAVLNQGKYISVLFWK